MASRSDCRIDLRGKKCPLTIMELGSRLKAGEYGMVFTVMVDTEDTLEEIKAWCQATGNQVMSSKIGKTIEIQLRKVSG